MNVAIALFCVGLGYTIGYLRGWMRGCESTRMYVDTTSSSREAQRRRDQTSEDLQPR